MAQNAQSETSSSLLLKHQANISRLAMAFGLDTEITTSFSSTDQHRLSKTFLQLETPFDLKTPKTTPTVIENPPEKDNVQDLTSSNTKSARISFEEEDTHLLVSNFKQKYSQKENTPSVTTEPAVTSTLDDILNKYRSQVSTTQQFDLTPIQAEVKETLFESEYEKIKQKYLRKELPDQSLNLMQIPILNQTPTKNVNISSESDYKSEVQPLPVLTESYHEQHIDDTMSDIQRLLNQSIETLNLHKSFEKPTKQETPPEPQRSQTINKLEPIKADSPPQSQHKITVKKLNIKQQLPEASTSATPQKLKVTTNKLTAKIIKPILVKYNSSPFKQPSPDSEEYEQDLKRIQDTMRQIEMLEVPPKPSNRFSYDQQISIDVKSIQSRVAVEPAQSMREIQRQSLAVKQSVQSSLQSSFLTYSESAQSQRLHNSLKTFTKEEPIENPCNMSFASSVSAISFEGGKFKEVSSRASISDSDSFIPREARAQFMDQELEKLIALIPIAQMKLDKTGDAQIAESLKKIRQLLNQIQ